MASLRATGGKVLALLSCNVVSTHFDIQRQSICSFFQRSPIIIFSLLCFHLIHPVTHTYVQGIFLTGQGLGLASWGASTLACLKPSHCISQFHMITSRSRVRKRASGNYYSKAFHCLKISRRVVGILRSFLCLLAFYGSLCLRWMLRIFSLSHIYVSLLWTWSEHKRDWT